MKKYSFKLLYHKYIKQLDSRLLYITEGHESRQLYVLLAMFTLFMMITHIDNMNTLCSILK